MTNDELIAALRRYQDVHGDAAERISELQAKIDRLEARGITDLQHECEGRKQESIELAKALQRSMEAFQMLNDYAYGVGIMEKPFSWPEFRDVLGIEDCAGCNGWKVPSQYNECSGTGLDLEAMLAEAIEELGCDDA